jgi:hypothetical protein
MYSIDEPIQDYSAHSNYVELALIELGERDVFPHVGRRTQIQIEGLRNQVFPIVTGTFGGVDFLHSVCGELSDKAAQSELEQLEGALKQSQKSDTSVLKELLNKLPPGLLGDSDQPDKADQLQANAAAAGMQSMRISPKEPEEFTRQLGELVQQIYPVMEFHDSIVKSISKTVDEIPVLPELVEQIQTQVSLFVFGLLSPIVSPIINQVKNELGTGSEEIINSSKEKQHIVFNDDNSTDPTHSMLSKDHFSSVLNDPAGKVASAVLTWVVPQIVACWDDDRIDIARTLDRIINGVFHHPALRNGGQDGARDGRAAMFGVVERWWGEMSDRERADMRDRLSRDGVQQGRNHKEGVHDTGHGCGKPLGIPNGKTTSSSGAISGPASDLLGRINEGLTGVNPAGPPSAQSNAIASHVGEAVGGGALGSIVGGIAGGLLGGAFGQDSKAETTSYQSGGYHQDGSYTSSVTQAGYRPGGQGQPERYGQAQMSQTQFSSGGHREEYKRYEQDGRSGKTGYGYQESSELRPQQGGGYEQRTEQRYEHPGGRYESEVQVQGVTGSGRQYGYEEKHQGHKKDDSDDDDDDDDDDWEKKERKRKKKEEKRRRKQQEEEEERRGGSGNRYSRNDDDDNSSSGRRNESSGYGSGGNQYRSEGRQSGYGRSEESSYGRQDSTSYGQSGNSSYGRSEYSGGRDERSSGGGNSYGRDEQPAYGRSEYESSSRNDRDDDSYGRRNEDSYGRRENDY